MNYTVLNRLAHTCVLDDMKELLDGNPVDDILAVTHKSSGENFLHALAHWDRIDVMEYIHSKLIRSPDILNYFDQKSFEGKTALHEACQSGSLKVLCFLIRVGVTVDCLKRGDWTPLMLACTKGRLDVIKCLIDAGASMRLTNKDGWTSFHIACREGYVDVLNYMLDVDDNAWNTRSENLRTPLHTSALHGHTAAVEVLLSRGCNHVNAADSCGVTPLMDSVRAGFIHTSRALLHAGASIESVDQLGRSSIHAAAEAGQLNMLKWLSEISDLTLARTNLNQSALHLAAKEGHTDVIEYLVTQKADINGRDNNSRTPLHYAASGKRSDCVAVLLSKGADCSARDKNGRMPRDLASRPNIREILSS